MTTKTAKTAAGVTAQNVRQGGIGADGSRRDAVTPAPRTRKRRYKPRERACKTCGATFTPKAKHGRFCSEKCRKADYRKRKARTMKQQPADPVLEVATFLWCGNTFFVEKGHSAKYCSASHKTAAWRQRRVTAAEALAVDLNIPLDDARDTLDRMGLSRTSIYLRGKGYVYDEAARRWGVPINSEVFVFTHA